MKKKSLSTQIIMAAIKGLDGLKDFAEVVSYDIDQIKERDPAAKSKIEIALLYPGFHAVEMHRIEHGLYKKGLKLTARALSNVTKTLTGVEIHPAAKIGKGVFIDHGTGVVIGETAEIGDDCTIYQGVTLGGTGKHVGKRHPTLGKGVMVGAGAKILGPFRIGDNSKIAAGAVVLSEIPDNATAVGIPAKVVRRDGERIARDLDQVNIPDPIAKELTALSDRVKALEEKEKEE